MGKMDKRSEILSLLALALSFSLFLFAYFPSSNPGLNEVESTIQPPDNWQRHVGQLVIVVIDALRADFVFDLNDQHREVPLPKIPYLEKKLQDSNSFGCILRCSPPTVTLPRIKSMLTGRKPTYLDVINNINSDVLLEDSLLIQWHAKGLKMIMYGDETWERISPVKFVRSDPTTSFFVSDYTEVDNNITRHLDEELAANDWDIMILHYLGLDHIGHLEGPDSKLIAPKLEEMSQVIEKIYTTLSSKSYKDDLPPAVLIVGDHGMADGGGHGGATLQEVLVPLVVLSPAFDIQRDDATQVKTFQQIDLAPSLSFMLGSKIPRRSNGRILEELLGIATTDIKLDALLYNSQQLTALLDQESKVHDILSEALNKLEQKLDRNEVQPMLKHSISQAQEELLNSGLQYDLYLLTLAISMIVSSVGLRNEINLNFSTIFLGFLFIQSIHFIICSFTESILCNLSLLFPALNIYFIFCLSSLFSVKVKDFSAQISLILPLLPHTVSLLSSSFVEEEHQTFYFLLMTALTIMLVPKLARNEWPDVVRCLLCAALHRFSRAMNQTGDKWKHLPDLADFFNEHENFKLCTFVIVLFLLVPLFRNTKVNVILNIVICSLIVAFKITQTVIIAQILYFFIFLKLVSNRKEYFFESIVFLCCVLHSETNIVCIVIFIVMLKLLNTKNPVIYYILGKCLHFYLGNSNSLASIQVGAGYTGLSDYHAIPVICLLAVHTYSGLLITYSYASMNGCTQIMFLHFYKTLCDILLFCILSVMMRYHIFVWSVFSPKLLYFGMELVVFIAFSSLYYLFIE